MSRASRSPPITLFSFQDIITSVTGIFILMTLLLALQLTLRKPSGAAERERTEVVQRLRHELAQTEREIQTIEKQVTATTDDISEQAAASPERLARDCAALTAQLDRYREEFQEMRLKRDRSLVALRENQEGADDQKDRQRIREQETLARSSQTQLEKLKTGNWLVYRSPPGVQKQAWLVDVAADRILVARLDTDRKPIRFNKGSLFHSSGFEDWARSRDKEMEYFVLLVRPSGVHAFDSTREMLERAGFDIGYDLIGADQTVVLGRSVGESRTGS